MLRYRCSFDIHITGYDLVDDTMHSFRKYSAFYVTETEEVVLVQRQLRYS